MATFMMIGLLSALWYVPGEVAVPPQYPLIDSDQASSPYHHRLGIPTVHESAVQARRILNLSAIATFSTVYPSADYVQYASPEYRADHLQHVSLQHIPDDVGGMAVGLMEYYATCDSSPSDPIILALSLSTTIQNAREGSNATLSIRYHPPAGHPPSDDIYTYSPANLPRFSLIGHIERLSEQEATDYDIQSCYLNRHPDSAAWLPGNAIHESWWGKLVVERIYWIGGFGDRAYIGWIPKEEWRAVTEAEVEQARLVGEKGWTKPESSEL